jgi:hypothetical protein
VPGRTIYDFTKTKDLQAFQREMQESYSYIATQVADMQDTRRQKIQRGFYGGGNLPAPYVIERAAAKERQIPVIYRPWQPIAIALFERFRDYDYILARIARYIEEQSHIFPYPSADDLQRYMYKTLMRRVTGAILSAAPTRLGSISATSLWVGMPSSGATARGMPSIWRTRSSRRYPWFSWGLVRCAHRPLSRRHPIRGQALRHSHACEEAVPGRVVRHAPRPP